MSDFNEDYDSEIDDQMDVEPKQNPVRARMKQLEKEASEKARRCSDLDKQPLI